MVYEEDQVRERVQALMHREGVSQLEFANRIKRQQSNVSQILNGQRHIPREFTVQIMKAFPNVRRDWLLFGEGTMYDGEVNLTEVLEEDTKPRLPKSMSGGHLTDYYEGEKRALCTEQDIVTQFSNYNFSMILKDTHMSPKYERGDELFFAKVTIIEWGKDYILDTFEGPKFAKVYDSEECFVCASYNAGEFPDYLVPKNMVFGYYRLVGVLRIL